MPDLANECQAPDIEGVDYYELKPKNLSNNEQRNFIQNGDITEKSEEYV